VAVQSMTKTRTEQVLETSRQAQSLERCGCEIIRVAVPHRRALRALPGIKKRINIPLVADVHFSPDLALGAIDAGVDCVRVNPGNIGGAKEFERVARAARIAGRAVRVGVNSGSLEKDIEQRKGATAPQKLVMSALRALETTEKTKLHDVKFSLKSSDVPTSIEAYRSFSRKCDVPLHIGITEAGDEFAGAIRSAAGLAVLLDEGIGDTIRVSLCAPPEREVEAAWEILRALRLRERGVEIIACPTCGRCNADVSGAVARLRDALKDIETPVRVAVMGCEVNGPGEAASADLGVALNRAGGGVLFVNGKKKKKVGRDSAIDELISAVEDYTARGQE